MAGSSSTHTTTARFCGSLMRQPSRKIYDAAPGGVTIFTTESTGGSATHDVYSKLHGLEGGGQYGSGMGKETSYKMRHQAAPPDSYVGRRAVELGLITEQQLAEAIDLLHEDPAVPNQPVPTTLSAALIACRLL